MGHNEIVTLAVDRYRTGQRVAFAGMLGSGLLACGNIVAGLMSHSTAVTATGLEFGGDVLASSVVLFGLRFGARPADQNHPYGHGRAETLSAFVVAVILLLGGGMISYQSLQEVGAHHPPPGTIAFVALFSAIALRGAMSAVKFSVGRRIESSSLVADAWNDVVDILSAVVALIASSLGNYDPARFLAADHYGGFAVGIVVVLTGIRLGRDASLELMDTTPDPELLDAVRTAALSVPGVLGVEKRLARKSGLHYHVDLHIEVDPTLTVAASHEIARQVRGALKSALPWVADVLVHVEPAPLPNAQEGVLLGN